MRPGVSLLLLLLAAPAQAAPVEVAEGTACAAPSTTADLSAAVDEAKVAFSNLDVPTFRAAVAAIEAQVPCATDEITRHLAAEIHRMQGLLAFANRFPDRAKEAFAAARGIEPNYRFPETLVPSGNPVLADYAALSVDGARVDVLKPKGGRLLFDAQSGMTRPSTVPVLFQHIDDAGAVVVTAYLWPADAMPAYPEYEAPVVAEGPGPGVDRRGPRRGLLVGAVSSVVVSAGLYSGAYFVNQRYDDPTVPIAKLDGLRTTNNGLVVASGATLGVALGLGTTALLVGGTF